MFDLSDYAYDLPEDLIAQKPCDIRSDSRLLHIHRNTHAVSHRRFADLPGLLQPGDLLVVNDTRVIPARLFGKKNTGGRVEVLIIDYAQGMQHLERTGSFQCNCLVRASKMPKTGSVLYFTDQMTGQVMSVRDGICEILFSGGKQFVAYLKSAGSLPLPPYIRRDPETSPVPEDRENYQTVYARNDGAVAAPTAGLHFTDSLMDQLIQKKIDMVHLTLHVGYGTFVPVRVKDIREHQIHSEYYSLSPAAAQKINEAKDQGRRVVAVGTTSVRTLEFTADDQGRVASGTGMCDLYIYPGFRFRCVDAVITNFHLPRSTLLMLVSAFYDRQRMLDAYAAAVAEKYRFFSYGDAMLIE
ncbi:tRNA preQ1(34) S-adenosylmethionine ribosyltransferase-isomerase QueA [Desulfotignum balticum]|uniref:tRNA preQ1(34) S-adenosylmethionine ribosyltransferase-isomerase QueA n=1 Tax=Desulfotignum balticum TaxID=115781 RepID=UPI0004106979|nr:tRNA preQ1(34) S-adenosylmethionine ribosyltransferase-isomerase QueA [Desulfotignum balticum]